MRGLKKMNNREHREPSSVLLTLPVCRHGPGYFLGRVWQFIPQDFSHILKQILDALVLGEDVVIYRFRCFPTEMLLVLISESAPAFWTFPHGFHFLRVFSIFIPRYGIKTVIVPSVSIIQRNQVVFNRRSAIAYREKIFQNCYKILTERRRYGRITTFEGQYITFQLPDRRSDAYQHTGSILNKEGVHHHERKEHTGTEYGRDGKGQWRSGRA